MDSWCVLPLSHVIAIKGRLYHHAPGPFVRFTEDWNKIPNPIQFQLFTASNNERQWKNMGSVRNKREILDLRT